LKVWDWLSGTLLEDLSIQEAVEPYIVVKRIIGKNRWEENEEGGDEGEADGKKKGKSRKARKGKGKRAQALGEDGDDQGDEKEGDPMDVDAKEEETKPQPQKILAVRRIESVTLDATTHIVFSTIGYGFPHFCFNQSRHHTFLLSLHFLASADGPAPIRLQRSPFPCCQPPTKGSSA